MKAKKLPWVFGLLLVLLGQPAQAYYNATTGRWLSRDPAGEMGGRNLDVTLHNNLLNAADYLGRYQVGLAYKGLGFFHRGNASDLWPSEELWTAFIMRFNSMDVLTLGGKGTHLYRLMASLYVKTCCGEAWRSDARTKFFATPFQFAPGGSGNLVNLPGLGNTTPTLSYTPGGQEYHNNLWINPVSLNLKNWLRVASRRKSYTGTVGHLILQWEYQLLPASFSVDLSRFNRETDEGQLLHPETDHTYSSDTQPTEWSYHLNNGSQFLEFSWDSCSRSSKPYGTSFECGLPALGLNRRWSDIRDPQYMEYWPDEK